MDLGQCLRAVRESHVLADDETVQMAKGLLVQTGPDVQEESLALARRRQAVDEPVGDDFRRVRAEEHIATRARAECLDIIGGEIVEENEGVIPGRLDLAVVAAVEDGGCGAGLMLALRRNRLVGS